MPCTMSTHQEEKERFFARLDDLDGLDESTESENGSPQLQPPKRRRVEDPAKPHGELVSVEHNKSGKQNDVAELTKAVVPPLNKAFTEVQPVAGQADTATRNVPPVRRTNSEPEPLGRSWKTNSTKGIGSLFNGLTFCEWSNNSEMPLY